MQMKADKIYVFPNGKIIKINGRYYEIFSWCYRLKIERSREYVLDALKMLRGYKNDL
jgi:hypothetical protein